MCLIRCDRWVSPLCDSAWPHVSNWTHDLHVILVVFNVARRSGIVMGSIKPNVFIDSSNNAFYNNVNALFSQTLNSLSVFLFAVSASHTHLNISGLHTETCTIWGKILRCFQSFCLHLFTLSHLFVWWKDSISSLQIQRPIVSPLDVDSRPHFLPWKYSGVCSVREVTVFLRGVVA